jgi:UPF0716 family protein affecting phage T7 exclusion
MLGFHLEVYDYATFAALAIIVPGFVLLAILILGLPGQIAIARKHPEAQAVKLMGWLGFLAVVPWIQALMWAFKSTDVVDIRRFPREEQFATEKEIERLSGWDAAAVSQGPEKEKPGHERSKKDEGGD